MYRWKKNASDFRFLPLDRHKFKVWINSNRYKQYSIELIDKYTDAEGASTVYTQIDDMAKACSTVCDYKQYRLTS